jgi:hypothetical protein
VSGFVVGARNEAQLRPAERSPLAHRTTTRAIKTKSKKDIILEYCATHGLERAGSREIRAIQAEVRRQLGPQAKASLAYVASVLGQAGTRLELPARLDARFLDPPMEEPYAARLKGVLQFRDLKSAEAALRQLDALYREYREASDRVGAELVRSLALKGKQRAQSLGASPRVSAGKRLEKQEIGAWFRVWLETPELFFDWLELRKQSAEFRRAFLEPR